MNSIRIRINGPTGAVNRDLRRKNYEYKKQNINIIQSRKSCEHMASMSQWAHSRVHPGRGPVDVRIRRLILRHQTYVRNMKRKQYNLAKHHI
jgi:hypothetical protein